MDSIILLTNQDCLRAATITLKRDIERSFFLEKTKLYHRLKWQLRGIGLILFKQRLVGDKEWPGRSGSYCFQESRFQKSVSLNNLLFNLW